MLDLEEISRDWLEILKAETPLESFWIPSFETALKDNLKSAFCVAVGSGTDALNIALRSLNLPAGSQVLVPGFSFISTGLCILENQLEPIFLDIDPKTGLVTTQEILRSLTALSPQAILVPQLNGNMVDLKEISLVAKQKKIWVIEDAAQAYGSSASGSPPGSFSDLACLSFDPQKILGSFGSAGAILTCHEHLAKNAQQIRKYGYVNESDFPWVGLNSRLSSLQACFLLKKLPKISNELKRRKEIRKLYQQELPMREDLFLLADPAGSEPNGYRLIIRSKKREELRTHLSENKIETRIHYPYCLYHQKPFKKFFKAALPGCETLAAENLSLPCHADLSDNDVRRVIQALQLK